MFKHTPVPLQKQKETIDFKRSFARREVEETDGDTSPDCLIQTLLN
jgi:hypothetical protein